MFSLVHAGRMCMMETIVLFGWVAELEKKVTKACMEKRTGDKIKHAE